MPVDSEPSIKLGLSVYPQETSWEAMAATVRSADEHGYETVWSWDHLLGIGRGGDQPVFEAWTTVAAWAAMTSRIRVGLLVSANTFRHPAVVAKGAVTIDHISGGRFILGVGAGYRELEHTAHGIDFGRGFGDRLSWLAESLASIRTLLSGEPMTSKPGGRFQFQGARHLPLPFEGAGTIPILVPGGGMTKTLPNVAAFGDLWHVRGAPEQLKRKIVRLRGYCDQVGRPIEAIEFTTGNPVVIRDDPRQAEAVYDRIVERNGQTRGGAGSERAAGEFLGGPPELVAEAWRPLTGLGFRHFIVDLASPYDEETVERLPAVRELLVS